MARMTLSDSGFGIFSHYQNWSLEFQLSIIVAVIVVISTLFGLYFWAYTKNSDDNFYSGVENDENENKEEMDFNTVNPPAPMKEPVDRTKGTTDKYRWIQTDQEVEIFIKIPPTATAKDVLLDILSTGVVLTVAGQLLLDGDFCDEVIPSECNWQLGNIFTINSNVYLLIISILIRF